jgi:hypothetical protein
VRSDKWGCGLSAGAAPIPYVFFTEQRGSARRSPQLPTAHPAACTRAGPAADKSRTVGFWPSPRLPADCMASPKSCRTMALGPICGKVVIKRQVIANNGATRVGHISVDGPGSIRSAAVRLLKSLGACVTAAAPLTCRAARTRTHEPAAGADGQPRPALLMRCKNLRMIAMRNAQCAGGRPMAAHR